MSPAAEEELAEVERAYRRVRFALFCNFIFVVICCAIGAMVRQSAGLPPALLGVVFIVALVVFGGDIMKFIRYRDRLRQLRDEQSTSR